MAWKDAGRFECLEIPDMYKKVDMTLDTPVSFCLPREVDEGICAVMILRAVGRRHNEFVESIGLKRLTQQRTLDSKRKAVVSSKFFSDAHKIEYELEEKFVPFVAKQCVEINENGSVQYNFANAEQYLMDTFFAGKPQINVEVATIQYTDAQGKINTNLLKQKVTQEKLSDDMQANILEELGAVATANKCLGLLETCISFLQVTGGSFIQKLDVGDQNLTTYVKDVLLMDKADFMSKTISQKVKLKHIDSLWTLLKDYTTIDPFESVHGKYKAKLDEKEVDALKSAAPKLKLDKTLPVMMSMIREKLGENGPNPKTSIHDNLGFERGILDEETYMNPEAWFSEAFPKSIKMTCFKEAFEILTACHMDVMA